MTEPTGVLAPRRPERDAAVAVDPPAGRRRHLHASVLAIPVIMAGLLAFHLWLSSAMDAALLSDGTAYLANAAWIGGKGGEWWMGRTGFYHAGYSVVLAPLFAVMDDPDRIYRGVLVVNALLATGSFLVYRHLARRIGLGGWVAVAGGLVATLYPAVLLQSSIEWSDNLYHLVFAVLLVGLHRLLTHGSILDGVLTGVAGAYLYAVHPRALGVIPVLLLALGVFAWRRVSDRRAALTGLAVLVVGFVVVRALHGVLIDAMWADDRAVTEGDVLGRLSDPALVKGLVLRLFGHAWYLLVVSFGLVASAALWLWRRRREPFAITVVLLCGATMGAGALMMSDATRVDHFVYGRYNEGFLPALLVIGVAGLAELVRTRHVGWLLADNALAIVALAATTVGLNGGDQFTGNVMPLNVLGVLAWETNRSEIDVAAVTAIALVITGLVLLVRTRALWAGLLVVLVAFSGSAVRAQQEVLEPWASFWSSITELPEAVKVLPTDDPVSYERSGFLADAGTFYQFELLDQGVQFWDDGDEPPTDLVITRREWPEADQLGARLIFPERFEPYYQALWVLPGALADRLLDAGFVFEGEMSDPIPPEHRVGSIDEPTDLAFTAGETTRLRVRVRHPEGGRPWPGLGDLTAEEGAVRLQAVWPDGTFGLGDLPKVLLPGQEVDVDIVLPVPAEPGSHELLVRLVQIGSGPFTGGRRLHVEVE